MLFIAVGEPLYKSVGFGGRKLLAKGDNTIVISTFDCRIFHYYSSNSLRC